MEKTVYANDIKNHLTMNDKKYKKHRIVELLSRMGVTPKTMVDVFEKDKVISRGTVYNLFGGYCKKVPRKVESLLLKSLKTVTEEAILVANTEKEKHKLETLNQIREVINESKKYLQGLDEMNEAVFDMGVLEENKVQMDEREKQFIESFIDHIAV